MPHPSLRFVAQWIQSPTLQHHVTYLFKMSFWWEKREQACAITDKGANWGEILYVILFGFILTKFGPSCCTCPSGEPWAFCSRHIIAMSLQYWLDSRNCATHKSAGQHDWNTPGTLTVYSVYYSLPLTSAAFPHGRFVADHSVNRRRWQYRGRERRSENLMRCQWRSAD